MSNTTKITPSILPGFMELLPREQLAFNTMLQTIKDSYELFGFVPLDTPIIEKAEVLMAKGGEETERQTYAFKKGDNDLALRFDLTVPLARYVSEHFNDLNFPFRRYQIGKVYRGEKPQKGRFRELYQCDVDIIAKNTLDLVNDAEILAVAYFTFRKLNVGKFEIRLNNRKILSGFMEEICPLELVSTTLRLIDKIDKIGEEIFKEELTKLGFNSQQISKLLDFLEIKGNSNEVLKALTDLNISNTTFLQGLNELNEVVKYVKDLQIPEENWLIDLKIARGLEYYTGTVYETFLTDYRKLGSVCSGGRYDNLAQYYTDQKLPGVGISIGLTRLFYQLNEINLINKTAVTTAKLLIIPLGDTLDKAFNIATYARSQNISTEVHTGVSAQMRKKLEYANKIGVQFAGILGENEIKENKIMLKNMLSGEQELIEIKQLPEKIK